VYALGSAHVGSLWHLQAVLAFGQVAGLVTVGLRAATTALHLWHAVGRQLAGEA
jgi:hypothetical protein